VTRVCVVTHYLPPHRGGVERVADRLARGYAAAGHDVTWIATGDRTAPGSDRDGSVRLVPLRSANVLERRFGMPYPLIGPGAIAAMREAIARSDVVHLHDCLYLPVVLADRVARRLGVPTIVTQHVGMVSFGPLIDPALALAYRTVGRSVLRHARRVAFVSDHVRQWFATHVDRSLEAELIPNGVDTDAFAPADAERVRSARRRFGIPDGPPVVLYVGRLVAKKNVAALVGALGELDGPWHALVVGDGPERPVLAAIAPRCTHLADVAPSDMPDVYAAADLLVLASVGEGMPLAVLEALASGLPVVLSDDPAFSSLEQAGAVLVEPTRSAIAVALGSLLADPAERHARARLARQWALTHASERVALERYLEIIAEVTA
jgi:glycosyltransferase involved in cell wall biosynthesis